MYFDEKHQKVKIKLFKHVAPKLTLKSKGSQNVLILTRMSLVFSVTEKLIAFVEGWTLSKHDQIYFLFRRKWFLNLMTSCRNSEAVPENYFSVFSFILKGKFRSSGDTTESTFQFLVLFWRVNLDPAENTTESTFQFLVFILKGKFRSSGEYHRIYISVFSFYFEG